jgi:putative Ca2+/H+ antiporter (TMEM165/GDT1 family)
MDLRVLLTTFGIIFLAEMGDKTQLAAMTMAADSKKPWAVFIGASLALAAVSALGVLVGSVIGNYVPIEWVKRAAAVGFIVIGVLMLLGKF